MLKAREVSDDLHCYKVGNSGVNKIDVISARGEGDKWHVDVYYDDGLMLSLFNFNQILYEVHDDKTGF